MGSAESGDAEVVVRLVAADAGLTSDVPKRDPIGGASVGVGNFDFVVAGLGVDRIADGTATDIG